MDLKLLANFELLNATEIAVKEEKQATMMVLHHLREIERRRLYFKFGYSSLFSMVVRKFGYSEASAQRRINAMRLVRDLPEAEERLKSGALSLTTAATVQSFFSEKKLAKDEKVNVLKSCLNKSTREVEKELASRSPERDKRENIHYTKSDRLRMSLNISEELYAKLETSKYNHGFKSIEDLLHHLLDQDLNKTPDNLKPTKVTPAPKMTRYISKVTRKIVIKRNIEKQCEYRDPVTNKRCGDTEHLQFDHLIPFSQGGPNITENLRQLCGHHNRYSWHHEQKKRP